MSELPVTKISRRFHVTADQIVDLLGEEEAMQWGVTPSSPPPRRWRIPAWLYRVRYAVGVRIGSWIAGQRITDD